MKRESLVSMGKNKENKMKSMTRAEAMMEAARGNIPVTAQMLELDPFTGKPEIEHFTRLVAAEKEEAQMHANYQNNPNYFWNGTCYMHNSTAHEEDRKNLDF